MTAGCTSLHAYMYVLASDYDGNAALQKEAAVKDVLGDIISSPDRYSLRAYTRAAISYRVRKTENTTHSFYVISREGKTWQTLSFSATGKWATSKGCWAIDTATDRSSYEEYLRGANRWHVEELKTDRGIDTAPTLRNIVEKIESDTTYYFRARVNRDDRVDNCNTALLETMVEKP
ncbi:MAG: hypothetical protein LBG84_04860 [Treponema sp.]|nr:hypothetical protein [Treponema sp.]